MFRLFQVSLIGAAVGLSSTLVQAAPVSLPQTVTTALGTSWQISNDTTPDGGTAFSGGCGSPGLSIQDASTSTGDGDLYDYAFSIWIDDVPFVAPGSVDLTGNIMTAGPVSLSGLNVTQTYEFSDTIEAMRSVVTLQNPSGSPISVTLDIANNFGSDSNTTIVETSSGDTAFTTADSWAVTWDTTSEINTTFITTPLDGLSPDSVTETVFNCAGSQGLGASYTINLAAGETVSLVFAGGIGEIDGGGHTDPARAVAFVSAVAAFAGTGISIVSAPAAVPTIPLYGLVLTALGLIIVAWPQLRRRLKLK